MTNWARPCAISMCHQHASNPLYIKTQRTHLRHQVQVMHGRSASASGSDAFFITPWVPFEPERIPLSQPTVPISHGDVAPEPGPSQYPAHPIYSSQSEPALNTLGHSDAPGGPFFNTFNTTSQLHSTFQNAVQNISPEDLGFSSSASYSTHSEGQHGRAKCQRSDHTGGASYPYPQPAFGLSGRVNETIPSISRFAMNNTPSNSIPSISVPSLPLTTTLPPHSSQILASGEVAQDTNTLAYWSTKSEGWKYMMDSLVALMTCYNWHYGFVSVVSNMRRGSDSSVDVHESGVDVFASLFLMELKSMFHRAHPDMILDDNGTYSNHYIQPLSYKL